VGCQGFYLEFWYCYLLDLVYFWFLIWFGLVSIVMAWLGVVRSMCMVLGRIVVVLEWVTVRPSVVKFRY